jgi:glycosyltransferase involved in cell wall biosynthesis
VPPERAADGGRPLTLVTIGSSSSTHVVNRVACFAERGHRVVHFGERAVGIPGVEEVVQSGAVPPNAPLILRAINSAADRLFSRSAGPINLAYQLFTLLRRERPDVVHVHYAYNVVAWMAAAVTRCPIVVSVMGGDVLFDEQGKPTSRGKWLTLALLRRADLITAKSDFLISVLERLGNFGRKTIRVVWGVRLSSFRRVDSSDLRRMLGIPDGAHVILSPKILQAFYNVHLLVEAMPAILASDPDARLVITEYGADAAYRARLEDRVKALGIANQVVFAGHVSHEEMTRYYSLADVAVGVPRSDGLPQTLLEGMACGVANVLSRLPRYEEIVRHEESAYFVDTTPEAIANGVIRVLEDGQLRTRIARAGRSIVEREANFDTEVARVEAAYRAVLRERPRTLGPLERGRVLLEIGRYCFNPAA